MPQKKNFPILERIRGRTAHMTALFGDLAMGQRSTPFTNLVEVSKEASANFLSQLESTGSTLRLFSTVLKHLTFHEDRLLALCRDEFYGGFQLANALCLSYGIPYRRAQVLAGRYILAALEHGMTPLNVEPALLTGLCAAEGYQVQMDREALQTIFSVETNLEDKRSAGSTNPAAVEALLEAQQAKFKTLVAGWEKRKQDLETVPGRLCTALDFT
jgi:argininosuccinate lyase